MTLVNYTAIAQAQELVYGNAIVLDSTGVLVLLLGGLFIFLFVYAFSFTYAYKRALRYVWETGIPHSQKEHNTVYEKWKLKRRGIDLSD